MYSAHIDAEDSQGKTRIKFETLSKRLQKIQVDILRKKAESFSLQDTTVLPQGGEYSCFLVDELERLKTLDTSQTFRKYNN